MPMISSRYLHYSLLSLLLILTFFKGLLWALLVPIFQAPDENRHYLYIQYLAEFRKLPSQNILFESQEVTSVYQYLEFEKLKHHPENKQRFIEGVMGRYESNVRNMDIASRQSGTEAHQFLGSALLYPPLYYFLGAVIYTIWYQSDFFVRFYALRIILLFLSVGTIYFVYKIGSLFFRDHKNAFMVATVASFLPQFSFIGSSLNNDNLLIFLITAFLYIILFMQEKGVTLHRMIFAGFLAAFSLLTKPQALPVIFGVVTIFGILRMRSPTKDIQRMVMAFIAFFLVCFGLSFGWYLRNFLLYHSWIGIPYKAHIALVAIEPYQFVLFFGYLLNYTLSLGRSFLGQFGWMELPLPAFFTTIFYGTGLLALIGFVVALFHPPIFSRKKSMLFIFLGGLFPLAGLLAYLNISTVYREGYYGAYAQGRSLFPLLSAFGIFLFYGIFHALPQFLHGMARHFLVFGMIIFNTLSLFYFIVARYYV